MLRNDFMTVGFNHIPKYYKFGRVILKEMFQNVNELLRI